MSWRPLSAFVRDLHTTAHRLGRIHPIDVREAAAQVATELHGVQVLAELPELVNVAALALSLEQLVVHELRPEIPPLVDATDLHSLPDEPPRLLRRAFILESRWQRGEVLFGDTASLGGYALDGVVYLVGLGAAGWARVARWTPHWIGEEIAAGVELETSPLVDDAEAHGGWTREAARFVVVLGLLLDAEGSPTRITDESDRPKAAPGQSKKTKPPPAWVTRTVDLRPPEGTNPDAGAGREGAASPAERAAVQAEVRGHLKRQPFGPGGKLRRWQWVAGYEARRWVAPRPHRVVVTAPGRAR